MKIIFLDIDGVLNNETDFVEVALYGHPINGEIRQLRSGREVLTPLNRGMLALLDTIITMTDAKIVISSTWRDEYGLSDIYNMFKAVGFQAPRTTIIGKTEPSVVRFSSDHTYTRSSEIAEWMEDRDDIESYVILDDISSHMFHDHDDHLVTTDEYDGLNKLQMYQAVNILGRNEEYQKKHEEFNKACSYFI